MGLEISSNYRGSRRLGSYLHRLRTGYGYSMRRVGERARAEGGEIDNSQLSRYEKGICYPSFDKLRVLASVFNVSVQSFSDMADLESIERLAPLEAAAEEWITRGRDALRQGDNGHAFACFECAEERLLSEDLGMHRVRLLGRVRISQATALMRLGRLALAEQELRKALRHEDQLGPDLCARALLCLANINADQGDTLLGEMGAERALGIARNTEDVSLIGMSLHTLGRLLVDRNHFAEALTHFREAEQAYRESQDQYEELRVQINCGVCYVAMGKAREGMRLLRESMLRARSRKHRRLEALAWSNLGKAYVTVDDPDRARRCFRESDAMASYNSERQPDLLFFNAFYRWRIAVDCLNPSRSKMAFGRLKTLRSGIERSLAEVREFDAFVERGGVHA